MKAKRTREATPGDAPAPRARLPLGCRLFLAARMAFSLAMAGAIALWLPGFSLAAVVLVLLSVYTAGPVFTGRAPW